MSLYREQLETWLKSIHVKTERVVDVGGASNPVRNRVASWEVQECVFLDLGREKPVVEFIDFDINLPFEEQFFGYRLQDVEKVFKFDALFCLEVFEYVWDPVQAMKNIWQLMNKDSVAYISFPAIYPVHNPIEIDYLRYTRQAILKYLTMFHFTQIEIANREATKGRNVLADFYGLEGMHPVRGSDLPFDIGYLVKARKLI